MGPFSLMNMTFVLRCLIYSMYFRFIFYDVDAELTLEAALTVQPKYQPAHDVLKAQCQHTLGSLESQPESGSTDPRFV